MIICCGFFMIALLVYEIHRFGEFESDEKDAGYSYSCSCSCKKNIATNPKNAQIPGKSMQLDAESYINKNDDKSSDLLKENSQNNLNDDNMSMIKQQSEMDISIRDNKTISKEVNNQLVHQDDFDGEEEKEDTNRKFDIAII